MREVFQSQLTEVQTRLVEMAEDTARIIEKATKAFGTSDVALADEAIAISDATSNKALALDELVIIRLPHPTPPTVQDPVGSSRSPRDSRRCSRPAARVGSAG